MPNALQYTVQSGDSLSKIAGQINGSAGIQYQDIVSGNELANPDAISVGQALKIPLTDGSGHWFYVVMAGDSLSAIANEINACKGVTWQQIEQENQLKDPNQIQVGQVLSISAQAESGSEAAQDETETSSDLPEAEYMGYWDWTWSKSKVLAGANISIAFSGWANIDNAVNESARLKSRLPGEKYISLGGGSKKTGAFTQSFLTDIDNAIRNGTFAGYDGLAYDIEVGDGGLGDAFAQSFKLAKEHGFKVLVTISHSAPYGIPGAADLMQGFFSDGNIDLISPQLYTTGKETSNSYEDPQLSWSAYADSKAKIVLSIVNASMYPDGEAYFAQQGVTTCGYIQWQQV